MKDLFTQQRVHKALLGKNKQTQEGARSSIGWEGQEGNKFNLTISWWWDYFHSVIKIDTTEGIWKKPEGLYIEKNL